MRRLSKLMLGAVLVLANVTPIGAHELNEQMATEIPATILRVECVSPELAEIEITSAELFPARDAIVELHVGSIVSGLSRYADGGDLHTVIFMLTPADLREISPNDIAMVGYNPGFDFQRWIAGPVDPSSVIGCESSSAQNPQQQRNGCRGK